MNSKKRLKIADRASLGLSFCGLVAAGLTQQIMFALAPLSVSLSLGLFRREELERKVQISQEIEDIKEVLVLQKQNEQPRIQQVQQLESEVEKLKNLQLNSKIEGFASQEQVARIEQTLFLIQSNLSSSQEITLIEGRDESRRIFLQALEEANDRLILVCPWLAKYGTDNDVKVLIHKALDRGVKIDIGWGHLKEVNKNQSKISIENLIRSSSDWGGYSEAYWVLNLAKDRPNMNLKILGTHEKYLICDRNYAMIGSHNFMTSGIDANYQDRELGVLTENINTIDNLIEIYDRSQNLIKHVSMSH